MKRALKFIGDVAITLLALLALLIAIAALSSEQNAYVAEGMFDLAFGWFTHAAARFG